MCQLFPARVAFDLRSSRDQVLMTSSIEAFAVVISREACITYSCGFQKLSCKNILEGHHVFVFPSPNAFHLLDILYVIFSEAKISGILGSLCLKEEKLEISKQTAVVPTFISLCAESFAAQF